MKINFGNETREISNYLKKVEGYLACEKVVVRNIEKHLNKGLDTLNIEEYLKQLSTYLEEKTTVKEDGIDPINFKYAGGFINSLLKMPCWKSWVTLYDLKF